jgi:hypothetical protein
MNMPVSQPASSASFVRLALLAKGFLVFVPHPNAKQNTLETSIADW